MKKEQVCRETEKKIFEKMKEIKELYSKAYPEGKYLTLTIIDGCIGFNNRYWEEDKNFQIDFWDDSNKEEE